MNASRRPRVAAALPAAFTALLAATALTAGAAAQDLSALALPAPSAAPATAPPDAPIAPPFNLQWGQNPDDVLAWAKAQGFTASPRVKDAAKQRVAVEVTGTFQTTAYKQLNFTYQSGQLVEVEEVFLDLDKPDLINLLRKTIQTKADQDYGPGRLIEKADEKKDGVRQAREVYQWQRGGTAVWLIQLTLQDPQNPRVKKTTIARVFSNLALNRAIDVEQGERTAGDAPNAAPGAEGPGAQDGPADEGAAGQPPPAEPFAPPSGPPNP